MSVGIWEIVIFVFFAAVWMGACLAFRRSTKRLHRLRYFGLLVLLWIVATLLTMGIEAAFTSGTYAGAVILGLLSMLLFSVASAYLAMARGRDAGFGLPFLLWGWIPIWNIVVGIMLLFSKPQTGTVR